MDRKALLLTVALLGTAIGIGILTFSRPRQQQVEESAVAVTGTAATAQPPVAAAPETVPDLGRVEGSRVVFVKREVTRVTESGEAVYRATVLVTDAAGKHLLEGASTEDAGYVLSYPFGRERIVSVDVLGERPTRVFSLTGEAQPETFAPPVGLATDFVVAKETVAYVRYHDPTEDAEAPAPPDLVLRSGDRSEKAFPAATFAKDGVSYPFLFLLGVTPDTKTVFVQAAASSDVLAASSTLFALEMGQGTARALWSDEGVEGGGAVREVIGLLPGADGLLVNATDPTAERPVTSIERYDLQTGKWSTLYRNNAGDFIEPRAALLSPDGTRLALARSTAYDGGVSVLDLGAGSVTNLVDRGEFVGWLSPEALLYETAGDDESDQAVSWHSVNLSSGSDTVLFSQRGLEQGTGLEKVGDVSYTFVGSFPAS